MNTNRNRWSLRKAAAKRACDDDFTGRGLGLDARGYVRGLADGQMVIASQGPDHYASAINADPHLEI